jgi:hypothetical protein
METYILLTITHKKPIPDLMNLVANRVYSMDGLSDVEAKIVPQINLLEVRNENAKAAHS